MTESSTPAATLKIRIRFDDDATAVEADDVTLNLRRVAVALLLILAAAFGIHAVMKNNPPDQAPLPMTQITAPPAVEITPSPTPPLTAPVPATHTQQSSPNQTNRVVRAVLTDTPYKRQTVQSLVGELPAAAAIKRFHFFSEVQNVSSQRFTHRWEYRGKPVAQIVFSPSGKNWAGASSKQIPTHMQGAWRVVLVNESGVELTSVAFTYGKELTPKTAV